MEKHFDLLGKPARDLVTGHEGVVTTISFDLYGCVQVVITPLAREGKVLCGDWFDVTRIEILDDEPVMALPDFEKGYVAEGKKGCATKPLP